MQWTPIKSKRPRVYRCKLCRGLVIQPLCRDLMRVCIDCAIDYDFQKKGPPKNWGPLSIRLTKKPIQ